MIKTSRPIYTLLLTAFLFGGPLSIASRNSKCSDPDGPLARTGSVYDSDEAVRARLTAIAELNENELTFRLMESRKFELDSMRETLLPSASIRTAISRFVGQSPSIWAKSGKVTYSDKEKRIAVVQNLLLGTFRVKSWEKGTNRALAYFTMDGERHDARKLVGDITSFSYRHVDIDPELSPNEFVTLSFTRAVARIYSEKFDLHVPSDATRSWDLGEAIHRLIPHPKFAGDRSRVKIWSSDSRFTIVDQPGRRMFSIYLRQADGSVVVPDAVNEVVDGEVLHPSYDYSEFEPPGVRLDLLKLSLLLERSKDWAASTRALPGKVLAFDLVQTRGFNFDVLIHSAEPTKRAHELEKLDWDELGAGEREELLNHVPKVRHPIEANAYVLFFDEEIWEDHMDANLCAKFREAHDQWKLHIKDPKIGPVVERLAELLEERCGDKSQD